MQFFLTRCSACAGRVDTMPFFAAYVGLSAAKPTKAVDGVRDSAAEVCAVLEKYGQELGAQYSSTLIMLATVTRKFHLFLIANRVAE